MSIAQRELKFRAWNEDESRMMDWEELSYENFNEVEGEFWLLSLLKKEGQEENNMRIMQYTGLKDKNGVEIYEGDVVQNLRGSKDVIAWSKEELMWVAVDQTPKYKNRTIPFSDLNEIATLEVIGHIYDGETHE